MFGLAVVTWIGNAAAVLSGQWGAVSRRAQEVGCSREAMYQQARRVAQAVGEERAGGPSRETLLAENQRLREENRLLWELVDEAESRARSVRPEGVVHLFACEDGATAALILKDRQAGRYCRAVGDRHLAVAPEHEALFRAALLAAGYPLPAAGR